MWDDQVVVHALRIGPFDSGVGGALCVEKRFDAHPLLRPTIHGETRPSPRGARSQRPPCHLREALDNRVV